MKRITVYEHTRLTLAHEFMNQHILDALLKFNEFNGSQYFDGIARGIKFNQFVGIIQVNDVTIEILPKIDSNYNEDKWRNVLIQMLKSTGKLNFQSAGEAQVQRQNLNLLEIYFELYLNELNQLIHEGLIKKYRKQAGNVKAIKGKIDFGSNIRKNLIHKERIFTVHQLYDTDHTIHQVLNVALDIVLQFSGGSILNDLARRVKMNFPEVSSVKVTENILKKIAPERKTDKYYKALEIAKIIILNHSPDIKAGNFKMLAILFDMNELWEEYIFSILRKSSSLLNYKIKGQESKPFWGIYRSIRPDIVLEKDGKIIIIDTKWKRPLNNNPSIEDLRQMYAYSRFWQSEKVILLYPGDKSNTSYLPYRNIHFDNINHKCKILFINVLDNENMLNKNIAFDIYNQMLS